MNRSILLLSLAFFGFENALGQELAVDHFWIRVSRAAPESEALTNAGFRFERFDESNTVVSASSSDPRVVQHRGQGTASMIVRFRNMYLELIWIENRDLLQQVAPKHAYTLLESAKTSPIGIGLRYVGENTASLPFEYTSHWAPWMRPNVALATARRDADAPAEPAIFVIPRYLRWDLRTQSNPALLQSAQHRLDVGDVTRIRVHGPGLPSASQAVRVLEERGLVEFQSSDDHLLEIEFDGRRESSVDFRPSLPLVIYY